MATDTWPKPSPPWLSKTLVQERRQKFYLQANILFVEDLREFRNKDFAHVSQGKYSELKFRITVRKVEVAFQALGLNTEELQTVIKQKSFTTEE